jgi:hypothetical protein
MRGILASAAAGFRSIAAVAASSMNPRRFIRSPHRRGPHPDPPLPGFDPEIAGEGVGGGEGATHSFDDLVGAGEDRWRDGEAEFLRGLEIDDQLEPCRLLNR